MRKITYCDAINEAMHQEMERDSSVFTYGIGVPDHKSIFGSTEGLLEKFGSERCKDTPICEDAMTGVGLGAAMNGMRPVHVHIRVDFLLLAVNQLANMVSTMRYSSGGKTKVPLVIRAVVGRGWGQGFQHSKTMHSLFAHIPGLKVIAPTTASDAKGMLISAIRDDNPVIILEHRWLYWQEGDVEEAPFEIELGKANILREGTDISIIATSWMNVEAAHAANILRKSHNINVEIVDVRSFAPLDTETILNSVKKTKKCIVVDNDWSFCGFSAELSAMIYENCFSTLSAPIRRIGFAHTPCPTARHLENEFYPNALNIVREIEDMFELDEADLSDEEFYSHEERFKGPF